MIDPFGRSIAYIRVSVTDRCDLRCVYCMAEDMTFLPKAEVLSLEELELLCSAFIGLGCERCASPGASRWSAERDEPRGAASASVSGGGLEELTLTTNGTQLAASRFGAGRRRRTPHQRAPRYARS